MAESDLFQSDVLAKVLSTFDEAPGLAGVLLIGSAGSGRADYFSDLDLLCLWDEILERPKRYLALRALSESDRLSPQLLRHERMELDRLRVGDREVELMHVTIAAIERVIEQVVVQQDVERYSPDRYGFWSPLSWLQSGLALSDPDGRVLEIQGRLRRLPDDLIEKMVGQQLAALKLPVLYHLHKAAMRGDGAFLHTVLDDVMGHLMRAIFALNGRFYPGARWLAQELATLRYQPDRLYERLIGMFTTSPQFARDIPPQMQQLVRETALLVRPWFPDAVPAWTLGTPAPAQR